MFMRTFVRAVLVSIALTSASVAVACPIDLAPCEEVVTLHNEPISGVRLDDDMLESVQEEAAFAPLQTVLFDHEGDPLVPNFHLAASLLQGTDCLDLTDLLPRLAADVQGDENLRDVDATGSVAPGATGNVSEPEWALDGYEDR
jgi:hypothetical protein